MIDTELLSQIQAAGITDADYERVERHIEVLKTLSNLTYKGIFIYDNFKRKYLYMSPNPFGWLEYNKEAFENMGSIFIDAFIKPNSKKAIIDAFVYCYQYIKNLSQEEKENIAIYCNYDYMSIDGKHLPSTKCTPLEFAPDGSPWLMLGITTSEPHGKHDMFCIHKPEFGISDSRFSCYVGFPTDAYYIYLPNNMDGKMQNCKVQIKFTLS